MFQFPGFSYSKGKLNWIQNFQKLLSVTVTRPPIYRPEEPDKPTPARLSICYFTAEYGARDAEEKTPGIKSAKDSDKIKELYKCEAALVDDRDGESLVRAKD